MKTRYSSLVAIKKNAMQQSEQQLQKANQALHSAQEALRLSLEELQNIPPLEHGQASDFLANRTLLDSQRRLIVHNENWVVYASRDVERAKEELKLVTIEYEKFKYLEHQEIQRILQEAKTKEAKDLDEVALMTFMQNREIRQAI